MPDIPKNRKVRVIVCSDAKNEADDQYAIVHALLTRSFDIKGLVAVHFREEEAPDFDDNSRYVKNPGNRKIRIYDRLNNRMIMEDMFSKIQLYHLSGQEKKVSSE